MNNSNVMQSFIWQITEYFFIISIVMFFLLFVLKSYLNRELESRRKFKLNLDNYLEKLDTLKESELIQYVQAMGELLLSVDEKERNKIEKELNKREVFERVYSIYKNRYFDVSKLYILSTLVALQNPKIRELCFDIINNKKINKKLPEFTTVALKGLSLSTKKAYHILELYNVLEIMRKKDYITQEFSKFFFAETISVINSSIIIQFIKNLQFQEITVTTYSFLDALLNLSKNYEIYSALLNLRDNHKQGYKLNQYIYKIEKAWGIENEQVSIKNHNISSELNFALETSTIEFMKLLERSEELNFNLLNVNPSAYFKMKRELRAINSYYQNLANRYGEKVSLYSSLTKNRDIKSNSKLGVV